MHVVIVGTGPAGVSAALYARRGGADVTVVAKDGGALCAADRIENFYGLEEPISGFCIAAVRVPVVWGLYLNAMRWWALPRRRKVTAISSSDGSAAMRRMP